MNRFFFTSHSHQRRQTGLSLIELMIGMAIGLIILGAIVSAFLGSRQTYRYNEELSRLQENSRFAVETIQRHMRMAGHVGCAMLQEVNGNIAANTQGESIADSPTIIMKDLSAVSAFQYSASNQGIVGTVGKKAVAGSDVITLRYGQGPSTTLDTTKNDAVSAGDTSFFIRDNALGFSRGEAVIISDCKRAGIFRISNNPASGNSVSLELKKTGGYNTEDGFTSINVGEDARIMRMANVSFFVGPSTARTTNRQGSTFNSLYMASQAFQSVADEIVEGVVDMVVEYGIPSASDGTQAERYVSFANVTDWNKVIAIKVTLLLSSVDDNVVTDKQSVTFNGTTYTDHRMYTTASTTVSLRRTF